MIIIVEFIATTASTVTRWTIILLLEATSTESFIRKGFIPNKAIHLQLKKIHFSYQIFPLAFPQKF